MASTSQSSPSRPLQSLPNYSTTSSSRLHSLYSDFSRQKQSNPASYSQNIEWWRQTLSQLVSCGIQGKGQQHGLILSVGQTLMDGLKLQGAGKPLALGAVVNELRKSHEYISVLDFLSLDVSIYQPEWLPKRIASFVVGKPLWWALEKAGLVEEEVYISNNARKDWWGEYVMVRRVEEAADNVQEVLKEKAISPADMLYDLDSFRRMFGKVAREGDVDEILTEKDAKVLLKYLVRDRKVLVVEKEVIKFVDASAAEEARRITAVDRGILELKSAIANLSRQIQGIQQRIDECTRKASDALQRKHKSVALSHLRSKKLCEDLLAKRLGSLHTLESTMSSVETAAGDVEIMKSYEASTTTLRTILSHPSLQRDKIDETMDALAEATADVREIHESITAPISSVDEIDDSELADELAALEKEVLHEKTENERSRLESINVPSSLPVRESEEERVLVHTT